MNIQNEIEKCIMIVEQYEKEPNANNLFKVFYELVARLKKIVAVLKSR